MTATFKYERSSGPVGLVILKGLYSTKNLINIPRSRSVQVFSVHTNACTVVCTSNISTSLDTTTRSVRSVQYNIGNDENRNR